VEGDAEAGDVEEGGIERSGDVEMRFDAAGALEGDDQVGDADGAEDGP
jgi:hypothetical protein